ncbi:MAG: DUF2812 domain-containing protein [Coprobacillus sp.]
MEMKIMRKFFGLADFLDEQRFLEAQHRNGWKFVKFQGVIKYTFERCEPEEYVYQLDYKEDEKDEEQYIQMFIDCGWEYIMKFQTWYYFRKLKTNVSHQDNEIFSDKESRIDMIKKVMWKNLLICGLLVLPLYLYLTRAIQFDGKDSMYIGIMIFYGFVMMGILSLNVRNVIKLNKLIHELEYPIEDNRHL